MRIIDYYMAKFIRQLDSQKWGNHVREEEGESFVMTLADMDLPLYEPFRHSIVNRLQMVNNFTYKRISTECFQSIIDWYRRRHLKAPNASIAPSEILQTPSLLNIIYLLIDKLTKKQDRILLLTPVYNYYDRISKFFKRRVVESTLYAQTVNNQVRYDINFTDLEEKAKQCKIMIFCNPHNPSGRIWNQKQVEKIVDICQKNKILIISDEILSDLIPQKHFNKFYSMVNSSYQGIIVCNSTSKAFNAESLRGGYAIIRDPSVRRQCSEVLSQLNLYNNQFAMMCTEIFYSQDGLDWIDYSLSIIAQNYQYLLERIQGTLLAVSELQAAYIITINFESYLKYIQRWHAQQPEKSHSKHIVSYFLRQHGIRGIEMIYGSLHAGILTDIRLAIAIEPHLFRKFSDKLRACVLQLQYEFKDIEPKL